MANDSSLVASERFEYCTFFASNIERFSGIRVDRIVPNVLICCLSTYDTLF